MLDSEKACKNKNRTMGDCISEGRKPWGDLHHTQIYTKMQRLTISTKHNAVMVLTKNSQQGM